MGKRDRFNQKGSKAPTTKKKFTAPTVGIEDVYFTWGTVSDAARNAKVVDKLREYVEVHFRDQVTVATRAIEELKPSLFS